MVRTDVRAAVSIYAADKAPYILSVLTGKPEKNLEILEQNIKVLKRGLYSSVASLALVYRDKETPHTGTRRALIKYFEKENREKNRFKNYAQSTIDTCNFLSGNEDFPKYYFSESNDIGTFLVLQQIGDTTLSEAAVNYKGDSLRIFLQGVLPYISQFKINATKSLGKWLNKNEATPEKFFNIFGRRPSAKRILDYLRAVKGKSDVSELDKGLVKAVLESSVPIQKVYAPRRENFGVTHGDLISKNILCVGEEKQKYGFIDAELSILTPVLDLSALLASPGIDLRPSDWKALTDLFVCNDRIEESRVKEDLHTLKDRIVPKLEARGVEFANDEPPGNDYFYTFMGLFFRTGRIAAKVEDLQLFHPDIYKRMADDDPTLHTTVGEMRKKMSLSLGEVVRDHKTFGISRVDYFEQLTKLQEILGNEGIIDFVEDRCPISRELRRRERWSSPTTPQRETKRTKTPQQNRSLESA